MMVFPSDDSVSVLGILVHGTERVQKPLDRSQLQGVSMGVRGGVGVFMGGRGAAQTHVHGPLGRITHVRYSPPVVLLMSATAHQ